MRYKRSTARCRWVSERVSEAALLAGGQYSWPLPAACPSCHCRLGRQAMRRPEPAPSALLHAAGVQEEAEAVTAQLQAASAQYQAAKAERDDVVGQWQQDRQDLEEQIRWVLVGG